MSEIDNAPFPVEEVAPEIENMGGVEWGDLQLSPELRAMQLEMDSPSPPGTPVTRHYDAEPQNALDGIIVVTQGWYNRREEHTEPCFLTGAFEVCRISRPIRLDDERTFIITKVGSVDQGGSVYRTIDMVHILADPSGRQKAGRTFMEDARVDDVIVIGPPGITEKVRRVDGNLDRLQL